jgi:hypothetical protein
MKDLFRQIGIIFFAGALSTSFLYSQRQAIHSQNKIVHKRAVTLQTILSCTNDALIDEIFKTDAETARLKLNGFLMVEAKHKQISIPDYAALRYKGFVTDIIDESHVNIHPTDISTGVPIPEVNLPFCRDFPTATYNTSNESSPSLVSISGEDWLLNSNEIFSHADQFHFDSGVFTNSSDIYFTATKGRTSIQFIAKPDGLKFYRVLYSISE